MKNMKYRLLSLLACVLLPYVSFAQKTYELYVGDDVLMTAPTPPNNGALYQTSWAARTQGITVTKEGSYAARAKVTKYFKGVGEVQCDYYWYNYVGNQQITNHSTVYYKIYCKQVNVSLNKSSITLDVGGSEYLTHSFSPSNVKTKPNVTWSSSRPSVAEVDNSGRVTARSAGTAEIIIRTDQETSATCIVTVIDPNAGGGSSGGGTGGDNSDSGGSSNAPSSVSLQNTLDLSKGESYTLKPVLQPSGTSATFSWSSADENVVTVTSSGKVTAISYGTTVVTVKTNNGLSASCKINVLEAPSSISLPSETYMTLGYGYVLTPMLSPSNSKTSFTWTSSDISIATVNSTGKVTAKKPGTVTIKVNTLNGLEAQTILKVCEAESGLDNRNVNERFSKIRTLVSDTLNGR